MSSDMGSVPDPITNRLIGAEFSALRLIITPRALRS